MTYNTNKTLIFSQFLDNKKLYIKLKSGDTIIDEEYFDREYQYMNEIGMDEWLFRKGANPLKAVNQLGCYIQPINCVNW